MRARFGALIPGLLLGCGGSDQPVVIDPIPDPPRPALMGADISALERIEQAGAVFRDNGQPGDAITILRSYGADIFRLRLFVNPNGTEVQVNDLDYTVRLAGRVKASGARLLLDIQYSDTWADPGRQDTPAAWVALAPAALEQRVRDYTDSVITALKQAGALPYIVQIGNEIDCGMLWPTGRVCGPGYDTPAQWDQLARFIAAGRAGVLDALGPSDTVRIMLHHSQGAGRAATQWFFDHLASRSVAYDMIGLSYYPWAHGILSDLRANLLVTAQQYGKDVMVVETSYPWRAGGWETMVSNNAGMALGVSPTAQWTMLEAIMWALGALPGGRGKGIVWWYPEAILVPGLFVWGGGSLSLFDASGNVLPAVNRFGVH